MTSLLPREIPRDINDLKYLLSDKGPLAAQWDAFEPRIEQQKMFLEAARSFKHNDISLIEAGTGTGKTLAYLLPALISGKRTIVSTGLKNLQEQINDKDLEFIRKYFKVDFRSAILKGRDNYLCLRNYFSLFRRINNTKDSLFGHEERAKLKVLNKWKESTDTGDLNELKSEITLSSPFDKLYCPSVSCMGRTCDYSGECFITKARRLASEAHIVLVNHHLFMADLTLKSSGYGFLPDWQAAIFDEAHLLENIAISYFSASLSIKDFLNSLIDFQKTFERVFGQNEKQQNPKIRKECERLFNVVELLTENISFLLNNLQKQRGESHLWPKKEESEWPPASIYSKNYLSNLVDPLSKFQKVLDILSKKIEEFLPLSQRFSEYNKNLFIILSNSDPSFVYQINCTSDDVIFEAIPILVAPYLTKHLFSVENRTIILTSATMAVNDKMDYFRDRLGIDSRAEAMILPSPYNFEKNTIFYLPKHLPDPTDRKKPEIYQEAVIKEIEILLRITKGRALVLFTSYSQMQATYDALKNKIPYLLFKQGSKYSRSDLLDRFRDDINSVLMATLSFWQGVDVPGESLSAVIIDRIPFPRPTLPMTQAKSEYIEANGGKSFNDFYIPEATILLKQGLGRLVRAKNDKGLLCVLDPRLSKKQYGSSILKSLPRSTLVNNIDDVKKFFQTLDSP
jgi:ATP-dependent DNA helicase DinG